MRVTASLFASRRRGWRALAVLLLCAAAAVAHAQSADTDDSTPPDRVARLSYVAGDLGFLPAGSQDWASADLNRPLTTGDRLSTGDGARAELELGGASLRMDGGTDFGLLNLNDNLAQVELTQGTLNLSVRQLAPGQSYEIDTPTLALMVNQPGIFRVDVDNDGSGTRVTVFSGQATVYGENNAQHDVISGRSYQFDDSTLAARTVSDIDGGDAFDAWCSERDQRYAQSAADPYVSADVIGYQDLDEYGSWQDSPDYGAVWYPSQVPVGWAPYRDGHWAYIAPWGWTWVDAAPWGFAPYHYGRWAQVDDAWAWVPGPVAVSEPPVYAPALVAFVGGGGGGVNWGVDLAIGGVVAAGVAWFPLGPGEPWHPHWGGHDHWSPGYYNRVNQTTIVNNYSRNVNVTNIHNTYINYRAPGGVTAVPATAFVHGQPVGRFAQKVDPRQWRNAQINPGGPGIAPVRESFGPGLRNANYRPSAAVTARPVVATRSPAVPAAYHDSLAQRFAQSGGRVPGAGQPIVRTSVPAHMAGGPSALPVQNVRVVQSHIAGRAPGIAAGAPGAPGRPGGMRQAEQAPQRPGEAPHGGEPQARPGVPPQVANQREQPGEMGHPSNGVPRPPQVNGGNAAALAPQQRGMPQAGQQQAGQPPGVNERHEPAWTQPHTPMAQQAQQHSGPQQQAGRPDLAPPPRAQPQARGSEVAQQPGTQQHGVPHPAENPAMQQQQQARQQGFHPQQQSQSQPQAQTQHQPEPQAPRPTEVQAQQQPRQEYHPQPIQQPRQEPRPEPRPQQVQQQPRPEFHPPPPQPRQQQAQQQPRPEFHPQPQPQQPRQEPRPQQVQQSRPQAQPQHAEQHSGGGNRDEHHKG